MMKRLEDLIICAHSATCTVVRTPKRAIYLGYNLFLSFKYWTTRVFCESSIHGQSFGIYVRKEDGTEIFM